MMNKIFLLIIGLSFSVMGYNFFLSPIYKSTRFGDINIGEYHEYVGVVFLIFGILILIIALNQLRNNKLFSRKNDS